MAYNFAYTGFPPPSNPRMMNPPPNIHAPPPPIFHNNNSPWRPPPERPQFNINSFMTPPHVMQRPSFPPQNMFTGCPVRQVQRPHFTPDNMFNQEASKGPQENFPFNNNGPGFQNNAQHFQGHHGRGRGFMGGHSRGQGFRGGFRGGAHNGNQNGFNKTKQKQKVDKRDLPENNVYFCDICDRGFKTEDKYQEHVDGHIQCSFKDCPFVAAPKLVHLHARMQHSSGLAKKVWQVKSADDINKWREERKRNYPTAENMVRKKQEREEKIARGEVLHTKEFGKMRHDRGGNKRRGGRGKWRGRGRGRWRDYDNENEDYPQAVDSSDSEGPPEETVIRKSATDDEVLGQSGAVSDSTGTVVEVNTGTSTELQAEVLSPQEPNTSLTLLTSYGESSPDSQLSDDDCEKSPIESDTKSVTQSTASPKLASPQKTTVTSSVGVSPPSAEPQNQATSQDVASTLEPSQSAVNGAGICSVHNSSSPHKSVSQDASPSISSADPTAASPDSVPGQHQKHDNQSRGQNARKHKENHGNKRAAGSEQGSDPPHKKKKEQTKQPVHKYTLLEKLLAPDMRKERNKVLQCVHYIVKNKFFE